jgi:hypothetical protein
VSVSTDILKGIFYISLMTHLYFTWTELTRVVMGIEQGREQKDINRVIWWRMDEAKDEYKKICMGVKSVQKTAKRASADGKRPNDKRRHSRNDGGEGVGVRNAGESERDA